ncbi:MAG: hypothetical protein M3389_04775 [Actinomycetota bacterium]|nr:hypothetical protein [Actinomycetota bacterium]
MLPLTLCAALAAAPAAAAPTLKFRGKNENNRPLTFKVRSGKVVDFVGGINLFCIGEGIQFNAVIPPKAMRVSGGKFKYEGDDKEGNATIEINGTISGRRARGRFSMVKSHYSSSEGRVISCSGDTKWTAKAR